MVLELVNDILIELAADTWSILYALSFFLVAPSSLIFFKLRKKIIVEQKFLFAASRHIISSLISNCSRAKTVNENLKMSAPLLSRFDLVFILLDKPDELLDKRVSEHIMSVSCPGYFVLLL